MKRRFISLVSLLLITPFSLTCCKPNSDNKETTAVITVVNGTGSGTYDIGEEATIIATVPTNKLFDYWLLLYIEYCILKFFPSNYIHILFFLCLSFPQFL